MARTLRQQIGDERFNLLSGRVLIDETQKAHVRGEEPFERFETIFRSLRQETLQNSSLRYSIKDTLLSLGVPADRLESVLEAAGNFDLIDPTPAITDTYSGLVIPFTIAHNHPFAGKKANVKFARAVEIKREHTYLQDAAAHAQLRVITPRVFACLYGDKKGYAALVTLDTTNDNAVDIADQYTYFTVREKVFHTLNIKDSMISNPLVVDVYNRALAHTLLAQHRNDPIYATSPFALVHPWEVLEERLAACNDPSTRRKFQSFKLAYKTVEPRVREYGFDIPTTLIHGDARPENVWESPLGVRPLGDASHARAGNPEFDIGELEGPSPLHQGQLYLRVRDQLEQEINSTSYQCHVSSAEFARRSLDISFVNAVRHGTWKAGHNVDSRNHSSLAMRYQFLLRF